MNHTIEAGSSAASTSNGSSPSFRVAGVPVSRAGIHETVTLVSEWLTSETCRQIATANLDFIRLARQSDELRDCLAEADLVTADGAPLVWLSRIAGEPVRERVAGSDLCPLLLNEAAQKGWKVYLLGGAPGTAEAAARRIEATFPKICITGAEGPMIDLEKPQDIEIVTQRIKERGCDLLLVGLGCPKQEYFLRDHLKSCGARVGIGVGGSFDFLAGFKSRAPEWTRRYGLEWAYRLCLEPRRLASRYFKDALCLPPLLAEALRKRIAGGTGERA